MAPALSCFPSCEVSLPEIGSAAVRSKFDACQIPPVLSISVKTDGKLTFGTFVAGNEMEIRPLRSNYWQLNLQVLMTEKQGSHMVEACLETVRTSNITCFMKGVLPNDTSQCSSGRVNPNANNGFLWMLFLIILCTSLLMISVAVCTIMHKFYTSHKAGGSRKPSNCSVKKAGMPRKPKNTLVHEPNAYLLSPHYFTDERLAVIAEVDEKDQLSVNSSSGVESGSNPPRSASAEPRKLSGDSGASFGPSSTAQKASFLYQKGQVILPMHMTQARRNSQAFLFPASPSLDSMKKLQQQQLGVQQKQPLQQMHSFGG